jgi:hypothetical protein
MQGARAGGSQLCLLGARVKRSPTPDFVAAFVRQHNLWGFVWGAHPQLCSEHI